MFKRAMQKELRNSAKNFPVVTVTGPRQSGKTTLVKSTFPKKKYVNLEDFDTRELAESDPRGFLEEFSEGAMSNLSAKALIDGHALFQEFRGALIENYAGQELQKHDYSLYYWTSEGKAEVDFFLQHENEIFLLEVKLGASLKKKSLRIYGEQYGPSLSIRTSPMNFRKDGEILNCPLYLIGRLGRYLW